MSSVVTPRINGWASAFNGSVKVNGQCHLKAGVDGVLRGLKNDDISGTAGGGRVRRLEDWKT